MDQSVNVRKWYVIKTMWANSVRIETYYFIDQPAKDHHVWLADVVESFAEQHRWSDKFRRTYSEMIEAPPMEWLEKEIVSTRNRIKCLTDHVHVLECELWKPEEEKSDDSGTG